jgi:hypothetical protein
VSDPAILEVSEIEFPRCDFRQTVPHSRIRNVLLFVSKEARDIAMECLNPLSLVRLVNKSVRVNMAVDTLFWRGCFPYAGI